MTLEQEIQQLREKHAEKEAELVREMRTPGYTTVTLSR